MTDPTRVLRPTFAVIWLVLGIAGAALSQPWSKVDRSNFFVFLALVALGGGAVGWTGGWFSRVVATLGAAAGIVGVVAYFMQEQLVVAAGFCCMAVAGATLGLAALARRPDPGRN